MKCLKCGSEMPEGCVFCRSCGEKMMTENDNMEKMFAAAISDATDKKIPVPPADPTYQNSYGGNPGVPARKKFNALVIPVIILTVIAVVLGVVTAVMAGVAGESNDKVSGYKDQVYDLEKEVKNLKSDMKDLEESVESAEAEAEDAKGQLEVVKAEKEDAESEKSDIQSKYDALEAKHSDCGEALDFFDEHAVIVPDNGTETYHKFGCYYLDVGSFWIFNSEYADYKGYTPCSYCID